MTAVGASRINSYGHILFWDNPQGVIYNEVYFGSDSTMVVSKDTTARIFNGFPDIVTDSIGLNNYLPDCTTFYWQVVEHYDTNFIDGDIWWFRSEKCCLDTFVEDFENGLTNWTITTQSGCGWQIFTDRGYLLPPTATGGIFAADADYCGNGGGGSISTAVLTYAGEPNYIPSYLIEWDNDWQALNNLDSAFMDYSIDEGQTWHNIVFFDENDVRNTHEIQVLHNQIPDNHFMLRLRSIQPGWDWWWAIDNLTVMPYLLLTPPIHPALLKANSADSLQQVLLNWTHGGSPGGGAAGFELQRKPGLPLDPGNYITIAEPGLNELNYVDQNVEPDSIYTYKIRVKGIPGTVNTSLWGNEATAYMPYTTPVELKTFTAKINAEKNIILNWSTSTETNNKGFEVERCQVYKNEELQNWKSLGFVDGNGTSAKQHNYSFEDKKINEGKYRYRIKQIDFDGGYKYSGIVEIMISAPEKFTLAQNYPNPFNPSTTINYSAPQAGKIKLAVYNLLGQEVAVLVNGEVSAGMHQAAFNAKSLPSGAYFYKLQSEHSVSVKKMLLLK